jgi:tetratricopeptide (TPR) repeat protein
MYYWAQQDKLDEANASAEHAVQLDPRLTTAPEFEANIYRSWWQTPEKTSYYLSLLSDNPEALWLHSILAVFYQQPNQDKPEYAVTHLEKLVSRFPEFADFHQQLANIYERLGRGESAQREWNLYLAQALRDPERSAGVERRNDLRLIQIDAPAQGAVLNSVVEVRGSAHSDNFDYYKLESGVGASPTEWSVIGPLVYEPVINGTLGTWDTSLLPDGEYSLRVVVVDRSGNTYPAYTLTVTIKH